VINVAEGERSVAEATRQKNAYTIGSFSKVRTILRNEIASDGKALEHWNEE
jgi:hypothetical protein